MLQRPLDRVIIRCIVTDALDRVMIRCHVTESLDRVMTRCHVTESLYRVMIRGKDSPYNGHSRGRRATLAEVTLQD